MAITNVGPSSSTDPAVGAGVNGDASSSSISAKPDGPDLESSTKSCTLGDADTVSVNQADESNEVSPSIPTDARASTPWVGLFKASKKQLVQGYALPKFADSSEMLIVDPLELDNVESVLGHCLVGYFAGKFPGKSALLKLCNSWKVPYTYIPHSNGWLIFKFEDAESRDQVLRGGPYFVFGRPLLLKVMPSCFEFDKTLDLIMPLWVRFPGLPIDFWNPTLLGRIASRVGIPIASDRNTATKERLSYARALVEVDVSKDLVREVSMMMPCGKIRHQQVVFDYEPQFCTICRALGHTHKFCKSNKNQPVLDEAPVSIPSKAPTDPLEEDKGSGPEPEPAMPRDVTGDPPAMEKEQEPEPALHRDKIGDPPALEKEQEPEPEPAKHRDKIGELTPKGQPVDPKLDNEGFTVVVSKKKKKSPQRKQKPKKKEKVEPSSEDKITSDPPHRSQGSSDIPDPPHRSHDSKSLKASEKADSHVAENPSPSHKLRKKGSALRVPS